MSTSSNASANDVIVVTGGCCCGSAVLPADRCNSGRTIGANARTVVLAVPGVTCGACIRKLETSLTAMAGIHAARVNLTTRRLSVAYDEAMTDVEAILGCVRQQGYEVAELLDDPNAAQASRIADYMPRLGVSGFAAANVMLLSVSVWSGHASNDMDATTRDLFHWLSALIAMPATAYAAQPFFQSARAALAGWRLNMDVPISLGIILATAMSLWQTIRGAEHVYFDAAITLVFFLLIGRTLDERMRARAVGAAQDLMSLRAIRATVIDADGSTRIVKSQDLVPGMRILVASGERIAADGQIVEGRGEVDEALITGESVPRSVRAGDRVHAGTVNGGSPLTVLTTATDDGTLIAEIARLMMAAEQARGRYVRLADRAASLYAPAVHILGLATLVGWMVAGAGAETALTHAVAVLIITCPCALALAVPAVQVAAVSRLFRAGVIVKAADGLERLAEVDAVVFDKTGTLTRGQMRLAPSCQVDDNTLALAASLAVASRHPYARGIVRAAEERGLAVKTMDGVREVPGSGLVAPFAMKPGSSAFGEARLGSAVWCGVRSGASSAAAIWLSVPGHPPIGFEMEDEIRADADIVVATFGRAGYAVELLSGDRAAAVEAAAATAGITTWRAGMRPDEKLARLGELSASGKRVLMVGDGLNDAPALAAAHASISPSTAIDISQTAADAIFQGDKLGAVVEAVGVARHARSLALQNFALAIVYNVIFVPIAMAGYVTPLIAAVAMSTSSILVTANALRVHGLPVALGGRKRKASEQGADGSNGRRHGPAAGQLVPAE